MYADTGSLHGSTPSALGRRQSQAAAKDVLSVSAWQAAAHTSAIVMPVEEGSARRSPDMHLSIRHMIPLKEDMLIIKCGKRDQNGRNMNKCRHTLTYIKRHTGSTLQNDDENRIAEVLT